MKIMNKRKLITIPAMILLIFLIVTQIIAYNSNVAAPSFAEWYKLDEQIISALNESYINSVSTAIIKEDKLVWANSYGDYSDKPESIYGIASITKTFTATAVLQLYEKGLFDLDDDVNHYLPFELRNPNFQDIPITFRMLLSHISSLAGTQEEYLNFTGQDLYNKLGLQIKSYPLLPDFLREHLCSNGSFYDPSVWGPWKPGEKFVYSNTGFGILSYIVEIVSNKSFNQYLLDNIFSPLNMSNTGFNLSDFDSDDLVSPFHWDESFGGTEGEFIRLPNYSIPAIGSTGLLTSVIDLSKFLIMQMNEGTNNNVKLLNKNTIELMHESISDFYGLGWSIDNNKGSGHSGDEWGYLSEMRYFHSSADSSDNYGIILFINTVGPGINVYKDVIFDFLVDTVHEYSSDTVNKAISFHSNVAVFTLGILSVTVIIHRKLD
jgi:CubicO group peptidase (beta-lactamase class C family)